MEVGISSEVFKRISDERLQEVEYWKRRFAELQSRASIEIQKLLRFSQNCFHVHGISGDSRREWKEVREGLERLNCGVSIDESLREFDSAIAIAPCLDSEARKMAQIVKETEAALESVESFVSGMKLFEETRSKNERSFEFGLENKWQYASFFAKSQNQNLSIENFQKVKEQNSETDSKKQTFICKHGKFVETHIEQLQSFIDLLLDQHQVIRSTLFQMISSQGSELFSRAKIELRSLLKGSPRVSDAPRELESAKKRIAQLDLQVKELEILNIGQKRTLDQLFQTLKNKN